MSAARSLSTTSDAPTILKFPTLYAPPGPTTGSSGSGPKSRRKPKSRQRDLFDSVSEAGFYAAELFARQNAKPKLSPEAAAEIARTTTMAGYYRDFIKADALKTLAAKTREHYVTALGQWERFAPRLDDAAWCGMPIGLVDEWQLETFFESALEELEASTVELAWKKLRAILNHARRQGVIAQTPEPTPVTVIDSQVTTYTDDQITQVYQSLHARPDLQAAFVLALNAGMRPVDLFCLKRADVDWQEPAVSFTARKTGKAQRVPLAPVTLAHLARLPVNDLLFPGLTNPAHDAPESSAPAIRRNATFKAVLSTCGIAFRWPWKACRATCNTRLETHMPGAGVGEFVLGHSHKTVNAKHYTDRVPVVVRAINTVPQPACFEVIQ